MAISSASAASCGDMPMRGRSLFSRDPQGGLPALFTDRRVAYSFNTRVAIRKACDLLGLRPGDEILAPAYNCGSELDPLRHAGLVVTLYRVNAQAQIDLASIAALITPKTKAIYLTHYFGFLQPQTAELRALCSAHGLFLIEDCALSLLSGRSPADGRAGDISVFCFYKFFPTLAGGTLVLNNDQIEVAAQFEKALPLKSVGKDLLRAGIDMSLGAKYRIALMRWLKSRRRSESAFTAEHISGHPDMPPDYYFDPMLRDARVNALTAYQIRSFDVAAAIAARRENYQTYLAALADTPEVHPLFPKLTDEACPLSMPVLVENRDALAAALTAHGIAATPWWAGYSRHLDFSAHPDACYLKDYVLSLPLHQFMDAQDVGHVVAELRALLKTG
jgi:perosamine synthetase